MKKDLICVVYVDDTILAEAALEVEIASLGVQWSAAKMTPPGSEIFILDQAGGGVNRKKWGWFLQIMLIHPPLWSKLGGSHSYHVNIPPSLGGFTQYST